MTVPVIGADVREARVKLGLTRRALARSTGVPLRALQTFEIGGRLPEARDGRQDRHAARRAALEAAGAVFTDGAEPGVKLREQEDSL